MPSASPQRQVVSRVKLPQPGSGQARVSDVTAGSGRADPRAPRKAESPELSPQPASAPGTAIARRVRTPDAQRVSSAGGGSMKRSNSESALARSTKLEEQDIDEEFLATGKQSLGRSRSRPLANTWGLRDSIDETGNIVEETPQENKNGQHSQQPLQEESTSGSAAQSQAVPSSVASRPLSKEGPHAAEPKQSARGQHNPKQIASTPRSTSTTMGSVVNVQRRSLGSARRDSNPDHKQAAQQQDKPNVDTQSTSKASQGQARGPGITPTSTKQSVLQGRGAKKEPQAVQKQVAVIPAVRPQAGRLPRLVDEIENHLLQQTLQPPKDEKGWLKETAQLEIFAEEMRWLLEQQAAQPAANQAGKPPRGKGQNEQKKNWDLAVLRGDKDLRWALQQLRNCEREHSYLEELLGAQDPNLQQERLAELRRLEQQLEAAQRRLRHLQNEGRQRERSVARAAQAAGASELGNLTAALGDGNAKALKQITTFESELAVWHVKNSSLQQQVLQVQAQLDKAKETKQQLHEKRQRLLEQLETPESKALQEAHRRQQEKDRLEEQQLRAQIQHLQDLRKQNAVSTQKSMKERIQKLGDLKKKQAELEVLLQHLESTERILRRQVRMQLQPQPLLSGAVPDSARSHHSSMPHEMTQPSSHVAELTAPRMIGAGHDEDSFDEYDVDYEHESEAGFAETHSSCGVKHPSNNSNVVINGEPAKHLPHAKEFASAKPISPTDDEGTAQPSDAEQDDQVSQPDTVSVHSDTRCDSRDGGAGKAKVDKIAVGKLVLKQMNLL